MAGPIGTDGEPPVQAHPETIEGDADRRLSPRNTAVKKAPLAKPSARQREIAVGSGPMSVDEQEDWESAVVDASTASTAGGCD